jgi:hypothetical protein
MGMHEIEEMEQRFLTPEQLETKYGRGRKASIMPDAKPNKVRPSTSSGRTGQFVQSSPKPAKPGAKSKQTA